MWKLDLTLYSNDCSLRDVTLDTAVMTPRQTPPFAHGVELCECPPQYNSTSCQDPSIGFYRYQGKDIARSTIVIQLIGESRPCNCSGRSSICDIETGNCIVSIIYFMYINILYLNCILSLFLWVVETCDHIPFTGCALHVSVTTH